MVLAFLAKCSKFVAFSSLISFGVIKGEEAFLDGKVRRLSKDTGREAEGPRPLELGAPRSLLVKLEETCMIAFH